MEERVFDNIFVWLLAHKSEMPPYFYNWYLRGLIDKFYLGVQTEVGLFKM